MPGRILSPVDARGLGTQAIVEANRIVDHIFGARRGSVEQNVANATGLAGDSVGKLMATLAPVVMGALGKESKSGRASPSDLAGMLGSADQTLRSLPGAGALAGLLDEDGDGVDMADLNKLGGQLMGGFFTR